MFTSISRLRSSSAMQSRVTQVETYLKRNVPGYNVEMLFPVFLVAAANSMPDYDWVASQGRVDVPHATVAIGKANLDESRLLGNGKAAAITSLQDSYAKILRAAFPKTVNMDLPANVWFKSIMYPGAVPATAVDATPVTAAASVKAVPAKKAAPAKTVAIKTAPTPKAPTPPAKKQAPAKSIVIKAEPAVAVPYAEKAVVTKPVTMAMSQRVTKLVALGTSKDKRSQIIEASGVPFDKLMMLLASAELLKAGQMDALIKTGVK